MFGRNLADVPSFSQDSAPVEDFEVPEVEVPKSEAACACNSVTTMDDDVATPAPKKLSQIEYWDTKLKTEPTPPAKLKKQPLTKQGSNAAALLTVLFRQQESKQIQPRVATVFRL